MQRPLTSRHKDVKETLDRTKNPAFSLQVMEISASTLQPASECIKTKAHNPTVCLVYNVASASLNPPQHWIHSPEEILNQSASLKLQRFSSGCYPGDLRITLILLHLARRFPQPSLFFSPIFVMLCFFLIYLGRWSLEILLTIRNEP